MQGIPLKLFLQSNNLSRGFFTQFQIEIIIQVAKFRCIQNYKDQVKKRWEQVKIKATIPSKPIEKVKNSKNFINVQNKSWILTGSDNNNGKNRNVIYLNNYKSTK